MTRLDLAKERLSLPDLASLRGWDWKPSHACRVPYRADKSPSGSVFAEGRLLFDHSTGKTHDAPAVLALVENLPPPDACRLFIELAKVEPSQVESYKHQHKPPPRRARQQPLPDKPTLPPLSYPSAGDLKSLARVRGLRVDALELAASRGLLWTCRHHGLDCWAVTDATRWMCQVRRLDGHPFKRGDGSTFKAWSLTGSRAGWPVGIGEAAAFDSIAICEGGPDMLAVVHLSLALNAAERVASVGLMGASARVVADALPMFAGKRVRLFPHADEARADGRSPGLEAAARWEEQLSSAGATVDVFDLSGLSFPDGSTAKDLNDLARLPPQTWADEPDLASMFDF